MARDTAAKGERKANRRGAARLAAVQALYQMDIAGTGLNEILAEFERHWIGREQAVGELPLDFAAIAEDPNKALSNHGAQRGLQQEVFDSKID